MSTVGLELEWADVDRTAVIPPELGVWNQLDYTIVNSNGHANHPTGEYSLGGEINTVPTATAGEQAEIVRKLAAQLQPTINYRCNLHVHVRPDVDLTKDPVLLKRVARYFWDAEAFVYSVVEPIPKPLPEDYPDPEAWAGAMKRYRRRLVSHHYTLPYFRRQEVLAAATPDEFRDAHAPPKENGGRSWHIAPRPGMNLRSLWKHGTIEYRHFPGTAYPEEIESCAEWALRFTEAAIAGSPKPEEIWASREWRIPEFRPYIHDLEVGFQVTRYKK